MFIGHFGVGFAGKKFDNKPSLGTFFMAAQWLDLIWPLFILTGWEKVKIVPGITAANPLEFTYYPYSHSLFFVVIWGLLFGLVYYFFKKNMKASILLGLLVLSHWILDFIVHIPDLPIFPWSNVKVGLGLWNDVGTSMLLESIIFLGGAYLYFSVTKAKNKIGAITFWALVVFLFAIYIMNEFGSAPPSVEALGIVGLSQWLFVAWGYWIDKNRSVYHSGF
jgi:hypothetical protein